MEASISNRPNRPWGSGAIRRFLTELGELFFARFAVAPDMVREPAWWDEVGHAPLLPETRASMGRTRMEQIELWECAATSAAVEPSLEPAAETPQSDAAMAAYARHPLSPPNSHDRPSVLPSGVGDTQDDSAPARPVVAPFRGRYAEQPAPAPRLSMARYLRLNGMLQNEEDLRDGMELPRRSFRPRFSSLAARHLPIESIPGLRTGISFVPRSGFR